MIVPFVLSVTDRLGNALEGAAVEVRRVSDGAPATTYDATGVALAQLSTDADGQVAAYLDAGESYEWRAVHGPDVGKWLPFMPPGPGPQGAPGPAGPEGPAGPAGAGSFVHNQAGADTAWVIHHDLNGFPSVRTFEDGSEVEGDVTYPDANTVQVSFAVAVSGVAYLS